ncbi:uncharacterized protein K489DRAFT_380093 [Dissoconium aciculare CBS 342.82]|uniref:Uncharacterized protein n=1 Tax=Dissoconium aciculare CBS 342.82 TaxID=1314786 RepID=A0A6J3M3X4_9PEZI|nr:uncharacterized protein K489DRAFT_380093 [Dissoconium aciculare CBS 342.82]KAF1822720.1 hypothetical protein K489DRAFT_380093 [Dissoconium aciculare CBS 342.82]
MLFDGAGVRLSCQSCAPSPHVHALLACLLAALVVDRGSTFVRKIQPGQDMCVLRRSHRVFLRQGDSSPLRFCVTPGREREHERGGTETTFSHARNRTERRKRKKIISIYRIPPLPKPTKKPLSCPAAAAAAPSSSSSSPRRPSQTQTNNHPVLCCAVPLSVSSRAHVTTHRGRRYQHQPTNRPHNISSRPTPSHPHARSNPDLNVTGTGTQLPAPSNKQCPQCERRACLSPDGLAGIDLSFN